MTRHFSFLQKAWLRWLPVAALLPIVGCKSGDHVSVHAEAPLAAAQAPLLRINTNLPALYLQRKDFLGLDSARFKDKLVLQLYHQKDSALFLLAVHPGSKKNIVFDETKIRYPKPFANGLDFSAVDLFLGDQQTKRGELEDLLHEVKRFALIRYVVFEPRMDKSNHLYYAISGVEKLPAPSSDKGFCTKTYNSEPTPPAKLR